MSSKEMIKSIRKTLRKAIFGNYWKTKCDELREIHHKSILEIELSKIKAIKEIAELRNALSEERAQFMSEMAATLQTEAEILREFRGKEFIEKVEEWKSLINIEGSSINQINQSSDQKQNFKHDRPRGNPD